MAFEHQDGDENEVDDEDLIQQIGFEIEESVGGFVDEHPICHNVYPESDNDVEEGPALALKDRDHIKRGEGILYFGQVFYNGVAFKEAVLDYALETGRNIQQYRYDTRKLAFKCVAGDGCQWRIYCSIAGKMDKWQVRVFKQMHTCIPNGKCEMLKAPIIARLFVDKIREKPEYMMPMKIEEIIKERWKIIVSRSVCQDARLKALKWIDKEYDEQFARLRDYGDEIIDANPGSSVEIDTTTNELGEDSCCSYRISMERRTCTCGKWQITGIPCEHAYGVILNKKLEPDDYVNGWFHTSIWRITYASSIIPLRGAHFWPHGSASLVSEPPEPPQPGRKKRRNLRR